MDRREFVETRRKRYLAQTLEEFEEKVEKQVDLSDPDVAAKIASFKATVRRKFQAFETDVIDVMGEDPSVQINGVATAFRDRV